MKLSIACKMLLACFSYSVGLVRLRLRSHSVSDFVILAYHRVIPSHEAKKGVQAGMYVEPNTFEQHLRFLKKYFTIVPIYELPYGPKDTLSGLNDKPLCVLTFDDGWYDFYTYAFPILKAHQVPATAFLPTDFIGMEGWFWSDRVGSLFRQRHNSNSFQVIGRNRLVNRLTRLRGSLETRIERAIEILKAYPNDEIEEAIKDLSSLWGIVPNLPGRAFLSWEEVREMARSGLITFGSHTASHRILTILRETEIGDELIKSREKLMAEKTVNPSYIPFSYPNGNYDKRIAEVLKDTGYSLAVTTEKGWNHCGSDHFALKRVSVHQDMASTMAMLGCRIVGMLGIF